jgi:ectoine hydroxylase-related dioxygenase (phytanoyl-CoA dioxygenase family)
MSVTLAPQPAGAGGFVVLRGSHKMNFPAPDELVHATDPELAQHLHQPVTEPGDVVFFAEATVHGAAPWTAAHERRIALLRFAPAERSYGRAGAASGWPSSYLDGCTPAQRAVLEPAYNTRLDRPVVTVVDSLSSQGQQHTGAGARVGAAAAAEGQDGSAQSDVHVVVHSRSAEKKAFDHEVFGTEFF